MDTIKLSATDRPKARYQYTVRGSGTFPIDMLRYDAAYPAGRETVDGLAPSNYAKRKVRLISYHPPTADRWKSFGWTVS